MGDVMPAFVIDARSRELNVFSATLTRSADKASWIIVRVALALGQLTDLIRAARPAPYKGQPFQPGKISFPGPVLVMGSYSAKSSAGFTEVYCEKQWTEEQSGRRQVVVVGGLGEPLSRKGLRGFHRPISGTLLRGAVALEEMVGMNNSNCDSANAVLEGAKLLTAVDHRAVVLCEGQSDHVRAIRLTSGTEEVVLPVDHKADMFCLQEVILRAASPRVVWTDDDGVEHRLDKAVVQAETLGWLERQLKSDRSSSSPWWGADGLGRLGVTREEVDGVVGNFPMELIGTNKTR